MSQLRVNTIANTGGITAENIQANGIVTEPNKPAFHAYRNSNQTAAGIGTFDLTLVNVNNCYSISSYKFTAPVAGNYFFSCTALPMSSISTGFFRFRKNDTDIGPSSWIINSDETVTTTVVLSLVSGDLVHVHFYANGFEHQYSSFSGFLIG
jgi:hypothetical protein